jgi:hypothetical protein
MKQGLETRPRRSLALAVCLGALALVAGPACRQMVTFEETTIDGSLAGNDGGGSGGNGGSGNGGSSGFCANQQQVGFEPDVSDVMIVLDRSMGMSNTPFGSSTVSRLNAAESALETAVMTYQTVVRFGFVTFPGDAVSCTGGSDPDCCAGNGLDPTLNYNLFDNSLRACDMPTASCASGSDRALGAALGFCKSSLRNDTDPNVVGKYALVVTDGPPGCPAPSQGCAQDATSAVGQLGNAQVRTVVVQLIGNSGDKDPCLQQAIAAPGSFYAASAPDILQQKLANILYPIALASCAISLQLSTPAPELQVKDMNGNLIPNDPTNGWTYQQGSLTRIILNGPSCSTFIQTGQSGLKIYSCAHNGHP